jgi:uncharacterized protein YlzI (FlbEa/FlbD family)
MEVTFEEFNDREHGTVWINPKHVVSVEQRVAGVWIHTVSGRQYGVQQDVDQVFRRLLA